MQCSMAWALHRTEKEKPAAGKTDYWRDFWRSGWDSNPRNLAVQLISSQSRYDHFDTAPYLSQHQHLRKRGELMGRTSKNIKLRIPEKPHKIKGFRLGSYRVATTISSRSRYDRFDTSPYISLYSIAKKRFSVNTFLPLRHGTAASHTQPCRFAFLGQKARFLCKKGCSFGREPSIIGTIFFKFEVQRRAFQWHRQNKIWAPAASKS